MIFSILSFSILIPALAYAEPMATSAKDWQYTNVNSWGWNYSPENQITTDNVDQLEVKWIFPLQSKTTGAVQAIALNEGSTTPPLVVDGKVFVSTSYLRLYAIDAKTGKQIWAHNYVINPDDVQARLPLLLGNILNVHQHGITYWEGGNAVMINGMACDFYGVDADTGETSFWVQDLCVDVPGNLYKYRQGTANTDGIAIYEKGNQFIYVLPGAMHSTIYSGDARNVMMGIDMDSHQVQWRVFNFPPQDVPTKDWALQECDTGYFRDIPCSDVAAAAPENLEWDWSQPGEPPNIYGGVTASWGSTPAVDEDTGIMYTQTGNQGPYSYIGTTPGPRLYGSTIMAIDLNEGKRIWWVQPMPRDPYDYDCNWAGVLADVPGLGKVYAKGCKEGRLHVIDAETGVPLMVIDVIDEQYEWGQITIAGTLEPPEGGIKYHTMDPFSYYDMREMVSPDNSMYCGRPCEAYPSWSNGLFRTDMTYDPDTGVLYHYAMAAGRTILESPPPTEGGSTLISARPVVRNDTIVARDLATGEVIWTWYYDPGDVRAHMVVTKELLYTGFPDGHIRFFEKNAGLLLHELNVGSDVMIGLTTGQDSDGNQKIFTILGSGVGPTVIQPITPGTVIAIGLSERAVDGVRTTTVTTTSISRTTVTTTSATTLVSTAPAITTTVTSEVTEEVGLPAEITYAAVAVAVIATIAAAVLMMRRR